jgi:hypothetical protein
MVSITYMPVAPTKSPNLPFAMDAKRLAFNVKLNMCKSGHIIPAVAPDGNTDMSNFIDVLCECIVKEITEYGRASSEGPTIDSGRDTHTHDVPITSLRIK